MLIGHLQDKPIGPSRPQLDLNLRLICRDCKDPVPNIVEDFAAGDLICGNCGLVLGNRIIDTRSEWRTFATGDDAGGDPSRVGGTGDPLLGSIDTLESTTIGKMDGGTGIARDMNRIQGKMQGVKNEKLLIQSFKEIQAMCERIGLHKIVVDSAKQLFKSVEDKKLLKGKTNEAIMASCIYIACREQNVTRTFKEICELTKTSKKEIGRCYKSLQPMFEKPAKQISLPAYISRFSSNLNIKSDVEKNALLIATRATEMGTLAGKSPISLVAASMYFVISLSNDSKSAKDIADVAGCTEATLKNAYKSLYDSRMELVKDLSGWKTYLDMSLLPVS